MAEYQLTNTELVIRTVDRAYIPNDPGNRDRQVYEQWLEDGGVPDPYLEPPPPLPEQVSNRQFYHQLTLDGTISQDDAREAMRGTMPGPVLDYISSLPKPSQFDAEMRCMAIGLPRDDQFVTGLLRHLGVTDIDEFFKTAAGL